MRNRIREAFTFELEQGHQRLNLAKAALLLAEYITQPFDVIMYLARLDEMALALEPKFTVAPSERYKLDLLRHHLFQHYGFVGNTDNYYQPENSFLNRVMELRTGIPITLSVIYLEIGWRLGLPLWGIGLPRHFIVGFGAKNDPTYIDVFNGGKILTVDDCLEIVNVAAINREPFRRQFLKPVTSKEILFRLLLNLKQIYFNQRDWPQAYKTAELLTLVNPGQLNELKDLGLLALQLNRLQDALFYFRRYLFLTPNLPEDIEWLQERIGVIEEQLLQLN